MGKINILVVEDETYIGLNIRQKLENLGYHVIMVVASGDEAYQISAEKAPDLIVMDIQLEGNLDGVETAKTLWNHFSIPVVFVSGCIDDIVREQACKEWCYGFVTKPFEGIDLESAVSTALNRIFIEKYSHLHTPKFFEKIYNPIRDLGVKHPEFFSTFSNTSNLIQDHSRMYALELFDIISTQKSATPVVDMKEFISHITYYSWNRIYKETGKRIDLSLDCESISLESRFALPLGLVLSEAMTNSMLYAFQDEGDKDRVEVRFGWSKNKDRLFLKIRDNGIGFKQAQSIELPDKIQTITQGLGLKIIEGMALLLGGEYYLNGDQGTSIELFIPYTIS